MALWSEDVVDVNRGFDIPSQAGQIPNPRAAITVSVGAVFENQVGRVGATTSDESDDGGSLVVGNVRGVLGTGEGAGFLRSIVGGVFVKQATCDIAIFGQEP